MNIINIVIIGAVLVSLAIIIMVLTKSFRNVDKKIAEDISSGKMNKKVGIFKKIKQWEILLVEWVVEKVRRGVQKMHSWIIREKKKRDSEVAKAKDELVIRENTEQSNDKEDEIEANGIEETRIEDSMNLEGGKKGLAVKDNKHTKKKSLIKEIFAEDGDSAVIDSISVNSDNEYDKNNFITGLFKRKKNKKNKKNIDIKKGKKESSKKWSLGDASKVTQSSKSTPPKNSGAKRAYKKSVSKKAVITKEPKKSNLKVDNEMADIIRCNNEQDELKKNRQLLEKKLLQKISADPNNSGNYHKLGELYIKMKKYDDSLEVFKYILVISPGDIKARRRQDKIRFLKRIAR